MNWDTHLEAAEAEVTSDPGECNLPSLTTARALQRKSFPPVSWLVQDLLPEGLTLLAGKPKLGKSWLALQLAYGIAAGTEVLGRPAEQGHVLYTALEDNQRRLKDRLEKSAPPRAVWPDKLCLDVEWPRLDEGGLEQFATWVDNNPDARLVIIDTLATVRPSASLRESQYQGDYAALRGLHRLANKAAISIVVIHHVRKADAEDAFDTVSGSTGLTGAADTTLILTKTTDGTVLYGRGRDLPETERALDFDPTTCRWSDLGRPSDVFGSETRIAIRAALTAGKQNPTEIAEHGDLDYNLCAKTLQRMAEGGEIEKGGRGRYRLRPDPFVQ
ncbi:MAG: AAA family ATPase [Pseudomonadota bacterium]